MSAYLWEAEGHGMTQTELDKYGVKDPVVFSQTALPKLKAHVVEVLHPLYVGQMSEQEIRNWARGALKRSAGCGLDYEGWALNKVPLALQWIHEECTKVGKPCYCAPKLTAPWDPRTKMPGIKDRVKFLEKFSSRLLLWDYVAQKRDWQVGIQKWIRAGANSFGIIPTIDCGYRGASTGITPKKSAELIQFFYEVGLRTCLFMPYKCGNGEAMKRIKKCYG